MKRLCCIFCLLVASGAAHPASWSDLWLTQDQQAQRLLDSGKPADAASKFEDARRRAYAEIKAGQYADAAKRLESFEDPQSQYNLGNALARSGKLENALAAYDDAIKQAPADSALARDAHHNRELVAKQLEKQQSSQSKSGGQSQSGKKDQSQQGDQDSQGNQSQQGERNASNGSQQKQDEGSQGEQSQQAAAQKPQGSPNEAGSSQAEKEKQDAADAKAAMARAKQDNDAQTNDQKNGQANAQMAKPDDSSKDQQGKPAAADQPPTEQALALEQWLRQIPDDPSGLLRRKFLIEHLKRQQESRQ